LSIVVILLLLILPGLLFTLSLFLLARRLSKREPYRSFLSLKTRQKLRFFKSLLKDRRVPLKVKLVPLFVVLYLALPFDIMPDFIPGLGFMDDVGIVVLAIALVLRLSPRPVVEALMRESRTG
jgi:uncharacterized membrane protein YkvA (DUF1232 family)